MKHSLFVPFLVVALLAAAPASTSIAKTKTPPKQNGSIVTGSGNAILTTVEISAAKLPAAQFAAGDRLHVTLTALAYTRGNGCTYTHPCGRFAITDLGKHFVVSLSGNVACATFPANTHIANVTGLVQAGYTASRTTFKRTKVSHGTTVAISINDNAGSKGKDLLGVDTSTFLSSGIAPSVSSCPGLPSTQVTLLVTHGDFVVRNF